MGGKWWGNHRGGEGELGLENEQERRGPNNMK